MFEVIAAFVEWLAEFFGDLDPSVKEAIVKRIVEALVDVFTGFFDDSHGAATA